MYFSRIPSELVYDVEGIGIIRFVFLWCKAGLCKGWCPQRKCRADLADDWIQFNNGAMHGAKLVGIVYGRNALEATRKAIDESLDQDEKSRKEREF